MNRLLDMRVITPSLFPNVRHFAVLHSWVIFTRSYMLLLWDFLHLLGLWNSHFHSIFYVEAEGDVSIDSCLSFKLRNRNFLIPTDGMLINSRLTLKLGRPKLLQTLSTISFASIRSKMKLAKHFYHKPCQSLKLSFEQKQRFFFQEFVWGA